MKGRYHSIYLSVVLCLFGLAALDVVAQPAERILSPDGRAMDQFGVDTAVNSGTLLVGAHFHAEDQGRKGAAYFFNLVDGAWVFDQKVEPDNSGEEDGFGFSVAFEGDYAFVGAIGDDERAQNAGAVYVYQREGSAWQLHTKLLADDGQANDAFGYDIAVHGDVAIVGARGEDENGNRRRRKTAPC